MGEQLGIFEPTPAPDPPELKAMRERLVKQEAAHRQTFADLVEERKAKSAAERALAQARSALEAERNARKAADSELRHLRRRVARIAALSNLTEKKGASNG